MTMLLKKSKQRRGVTAVEFALTVPILFAFLFATYEFGRANMMRHTAEAACYEGCRVAIVPGATAAEAIAAAEAILGTAGITDAQVNVTPATLQPDSPTVSVNITMRFQDNMLIFPTFLGEGASVDRTCELSREVL